VPGEGDGRGRRARRRATTGRPSVAPMLGWVVFTLAVSTLLLLLFGVGTPTLVWLVLAGVVVGAVLLAAAVVMPAPPSDPDDPGHDRGSP
jgi:hypothetical protein